MNEITTRLGQLLRRNPVSVRQITFTQEWRVVDLAMSRPEHIMLSAGETPPAVATVG
jgi:hypothetical protein